MICTLDISSFKHPSENLPIPATPCYIRKSFLMEVALVEISFHNLPAKVLAAA